MAKRPSFQFYPSDWLRDTSLRSCSVAARGLWMDMLCYMHEGYPYGYLKVGVKVILPVNLAAMTGLTLDVVLRLLQELREADVFSEDETGCIFSRRMVKDERIRLKRAAGGQKGGNPILKKDKYKVNLSDNHNNNLTPEDEDEDEEKEEDEFKEGGLEETIPERYLVPEMLNSWRTFAPDYPVDHEKDMEALGTLAQFLCKQLGLSYDPTDRDIVERILVLWERMSKFISGHDFFRNYSLHQVKTHSQNIYQTMKNGSGKNKQNEQPGTITIPPGPRKYGKL